MSVREIADSADIIVAGYAYIYVVYNIYSNR